jgi:hypothetical protein
VHPHNPAAVRRHKVIPLLMSSSQFDSSSSRPKVVETGNRELSWGCRKDVTKHEVAWRQSDKRSQSELTRNSVVCLCNLLGQGGASFYEAGMIGGRGSLRLVDEPLSSFGVSGESRREQRRCNCALELGVLSFVHHPLCPPPASRSSILWLETA